MYVLRMVSLSKILSYWRQKKIKTGNDSEMQSMTKWRMKEDEESEFAGNDGQFMGVRKKDGAWGGGGQGDARCVGY